MIVNHGVLGHIVLNVADLKKSERFYRSILGLKVSARNRKTRMTFLSYGQEHHDIALQALPKGAKHVAGKGMPKLHHFCIYVDSNDIIDKLEPILKRTSARPWDYAGRSTLQLAINTADVSRVRTVLASHQGAPVPEGCQSPLLAYAVAANDTKPTRLLLDAGADPNTTFAGPAEARCLEYIPHRFLKHYLTDEPGMNVLMVAAGLDTWEGETPGPYTGTPEAERLEAVIEAAWVIPVIPLASFLLPSAAAAPWCGST